ncbi:hypothetical protein A2U01_0113730, partial [Trifolium medium]|nr:hypothetical protein [Trifolium medium]
MLRVARKNGRGQESSLPVARRVRQCGALRRLLRVQHWK